MASIVLKSESRSMGLGIHVACAIQTRKIYYFGSEISSDETILCMYTKVEIQCTQDRFWGHELN
jgi:hypothetical protein